MSAVDKAKLKLLAKHISDIERVFALADDIELSLPKTLKPECSGCASKEQVEAQQTRLLAVAIATLDTDYRKSLHETILKLGLTINILIEEQVIAEEIAEFLKDKDEDFLIEIFNFMNSLRPKSRRKFMQFIHAIEDRDNCYMLAKTERDGVEIALRYKLDLKSVCEFFDED